LKFSEILSYFPELSISTSGRPSLSSLHLCEAPGAFISSLLHYQIANRIPPADWTATTLNPWHEEAFPSKVINIDSIILAFSERWFFGSDNTGDIIDSVQSLFGDLGETKFDLVTSDGGFDCSADPECQEVISSSLKRAEYESICLTLGVHGNSVLKMFSCCHVTSLQILESAASSFQTVYLTKPAASKAGNSELYLIMMNYSGSMSPLQNTFIFLQEWFILIVFRNIRE